MITGLIGLLMVPVLASPLDTGVAVELRYSGSLSKVERGGTGDPIKRFSIYCLARNIDSGTHEVTFLVDERNSDGWPWPERFGRIDFDPQNKPVGSTQIRLLHKHDNKLNPLSVRHPIFSYPDKLKANATWKGDRYNYEVRRQREVKGRSCWEVEVANNFGRLQTVWVEQGGSLVVAAEQRVFMGRGDRFSLRVELDSVKEIEQERLAVLQRPLKTLLTLQRGLKRKKNDTRLDLNATQLKSAAAVIDQLQKESAPTPFKRFASVVGTDVKAQLRRVDEVKRLGEKLVGTKAPKFSLTSLLKKPIDPKEYAGKIVLLHFWNYDGDALEEPYGQVGYLDFLNSKRRKLGVKVVGVAVDSRLGNRQQESRALRAIRKLKSFMNLSYEIAIDNGTLLKKFGDPRKFGAELPLWVLIAPDGKIAAYKVGFYPIKPDEGLRELDALVIDLIRKQRAKESE